jgi:hypothetical protein
MKSSEKEEMEMEEGNKKRNEKEEIKKNKNVYKMYVCSYECVHYIRSTVDMIHL